MNYNIIRDEEKLRKFIEWLPELENNEMYYVCLFARKKYYSPLKSDKCQLKRFTSKKDFLFDKIKQLECALGSYKQGDIVIPDDALSLYITPNPRCMLKATKASLIEFAKIVTEEYDGQNPHQEVMSKLQTSCSRKIYFDLDFDHVNYAETMIEVEKFINLNAIRTLHTRGGFHLLVELNKVNNKYIKTWYSGITKLPGCDVRGDQIMPVPGCVQGGFIPFLE